MADDNSTKGRSNEHLERIADYCAEVAGVSPGGLPVLEYVELLAAKFKATHGLKIQVVPDSDLGGAEATAACDPPLIRMRETVHSAATRDEPRARMTTMHEFAHILLEHKGIANPRMLAGNERLDFVKPFESTEHQAPYLGAAMLMPRKLAKGLSAAEIKLKFRVSKQAAEIRYQQLNPAVRPLPSSVVEFLASKKHSPEPSSVAGRAAEVERRVEEAWARAPSYPGEDPAEFRLDKHGMPVRRSLYLKMRLGGWKVDPHDNIISYEYEQSK